MSFDVSLSTVDVKFTPKRLLSALPGGALDRLLLRQGRKVERLAKKQVGTKTGALKRSISTSIVRGADGIPKARIGSDLPYARLHHNGTRPHMIRAQPGRKLKFKMSGKTRYAQAVRHPGTRPNPYLVTALRAAKGL